MQVREGGLSDIEFMMDYWFGLDEEKLRRMGADISKLPSREEFSERIAHQMQLSYPEKKAYVLIAEVDGKPVGHCNLNPMNFGEQANMHLHIWNPSSRMKGYGREMVNQSLDFFFNKIELQELLCEPYAENPGPNKTLAKLGFSWIKKYTTIPGSINFEQEVNQWKMSLSDYKNRNK